MLKRSLTFSTRNLIIGVAIARYILHDLTNKWTVLRDGCVNDDWIYKNIIYLSHNWSLVNGSILIHIYDITKKK